MSDVIVCVGPANLMANHLWNHAALLVAAHDHGVRLVDPALGPWAAEFERFVHDPFGGAGLGRWPTGSTSATHRQAVRLGPRAARRLRRAAAAGRLPRWAAFVESGWHSTLVDPDGVVHVDAPEFTGLLDTRRVVLVHGPLFRHADRAAFLARRDLVVDALRPVPAVIGRAARAADRARRGRPTLIGVHVRRGDYAGYLGGRYFFDWSVYERVIAHVADTWGRDRVAFLVTSDETPPTDFARDLDWSPGPGDAVGDLTALGHCDLVVGPPSTFSHWASFVGGAPRWLLEHASDRPHPDGFVPA